MGNVYKASGGISRGTMLKRNIIPVFYMQHFIFRYIPFYAAVKILTVSINAGLELFLFTYSFKYIMDSIAEHKRFFEILPAFVIAALITLAVIYLKKWTENQYLPVCREKLAQKMKTHLLQKAVATGLVCYDNPHFYDSFMNAHKNADTAALDAFHTYVELLGQLVSISGFFALLFSLDIFGLVCAAAGFTLGSIIDIIYNKLTVTCETALQPLYRKRDYTGRIFFLPDFAKELRVSRIGIPLIHHFEAAVKDIIALNRRYGKKLIFLRLIHFACTVFLTDIVYLAVLVYRIAVLKTLSIGNFTALYLCMDKLGYWLPAFAETLAECFKHRLHAGLFRAFETYENTVKDSGRCPLNNKPADIHVRHVWFRYPGSNKPALRNITFHIQKNEKIAIVGYNGSGKSTLVKLLLRLYDPDEGRITVDGKDIRTYTLQTYRNYIGAVFQDFQTYACTAAENTAMDIRPDIEHAEYALKQSGLFRRIDGEHKGVHTQLGRELYEDGLLMSGGELQKLALARVFYRTFSCIIFDEPSAALDPISEHRFYASIRENFRDTAVIFISHRLTGAKDADRIYMMSEGRIIEHGTHTELMALHGEYAKLFQLQAEKYIV